MNLEEALKPIVPVVGLSSIIGAPESVLSRVERVYELTLEEAKGKLERLEKSQYECVSDYAFWGYEGQIAYWKAVVNILEAVEILGKDNLPDVEPPDLEGKALMDVCGCIERYGARVLYLARLSFFL